MKNVKTVQTKNGQTYYYLDGKRISKAKALELMNTLAPAPTLAIVKDVESDALFIEQAKKTAPKKLAPSNTALGFLQRTVKTQRAALSEKYSTKAKQAKRVTRAKNNLTAFLQTALITLLLLILAITGFDFSASQAINAINVYLIICAPTFLIMLKHYQDTKDDALANKI